MPKEGSHRICLSVISINSIFGMGKNYYPQVVLEECKRIVKIKEVTRHITEDLEISSDKKISNEKRFIE